MCTRDNRERERESRIMGNVENGERNNYMKGKWKYMTKTRLCKSNQVLF